MKVSSGFTLIEMVVVLAILGIVALSVGLSIRNTSIGASRQEAQRLAMTLESLWLDARISGRRFLWRGEKNEYRWWEKNPNPDAKERIATTGMGYRNMGTDGMHFASLTIDSRLVEPGETIEFGPMTPMFQIELLSGMDRFVIRSLPTGKLVITEPNATARQ